MVDIEVEAQIPGGLELFVTEMGQLDENLEDIEEAKGEFATPQQVAQGQLVSLPDSSTVWTESSRVAATIVYIPEKDYVLWTLGVKYSPLLRDPVAAVKIHAALDSYESTDEVYLTKSELDALLEEAKAGRNVLQDKRIDHFEIPISELHKDALGKFYFGNDAEAYGRKADELGFRGIPFMLCDRADVQQQKAPFSRPVWFSHMYDWSKFDCRDNYASYSCRARGVRKVAPNNPPSVRLFAPIDS